MRLGRIKKFLLACLFWGCLTVVCPEVYATENTSEDAAANTSEDATENTSEDTAEGTEKKKLSGNANLRRFKINADEAVMEPEFSKDVTEYTVTMLVDMKQLLFDAKTRNKNAQVVSASGFSNLKNGTNKAVLTVMAEDGTTKSYYFTIIREGEAADKEDTQERETAEITNGFIDHTQSDKKICTTFPDEELPTGCVKVKYIYKEQVIDAACFVNGQMILLYCTDASGENGDFYIYYSGTDELVDFIQLPGAGDNFIFPVQFPIGVVIPDGFSDTMFYQDEKSINAFAIMESYFFPDESTDGLPGEEDGEEQTENTEETENIPERETEEEMADENAVDPTDYYMLYAINQDGQEGFYLYDSLEGTYQRYIDLVIESDIGAFDEENYVIYKKQSQNRMVIIGFLIFGVVVLFVILINMFISMRDLKKRLKAVDDDDNDNDDNDNDDNNNNDNDNDVNGNDDNDVDDNEDEDIKYEVRNKGRKQIHSTGRKNSGPVMFDLTAPMPEEVITAKNDQSGLDEDFEVFKLDD